VNKGERPSLEDSSPGLSGLYSALQTKDWTASPEKALFMPGSYKNKQTEPLARLNRFFKKVNLFPAFAAAENREKMILPAEADSG